jgi:hypothetical protein
MRRLKELIKQNLNHINCRPGDHAYAHDHHAETGDHVESWTTHCWPRTKVDGMTIGRRRVELTARHPRASCQ